MSNYILSYFGSLVENLIWRNANEETMEELFSILPPKYKHQLKHKQTIT